MLQNIDDSDKVISGSLGIIYSIISMMALSPAINDSNTAIICINKISYLLVKLFSGGKQYKIIRENANAKIIYQDYSVDEKYYCTKIINNFDKMLSKW